MKRAGRRSYSSRKRRGGYKTMRRIPRSINDGSLVTKIDYIYNVGCPADNLYSLIAIGADGIY